MWTSRLYGCTHCLFAGELNSSNKQTPKILLWYGLNLRCPTLLRIGGIILIFDNLQTTLKSAKHLNIPVETIALPLKNGSDTHWTFDASGTASVAAATAARSEWTQYNLMEPILPLPLPLPLTLTLPLGVNEPLTWIKDLRTDPC